MYEKGLLQNIQCKTAQLNNDCQVQKVLRNHEYLVLSGHIHDIAQPKTTLGYNTNTMLAYKLTVYTAVACSCSKTQTLPIHTLDTCSHHG